MSRDDRPPECPFPSREVKPALRVRFDSNYRPCGRLRRRLAIIVTAMAQDQKNIIGILLAAGTGSRFGGDKLLHPLPDGVAIAAHAARNLLGAGLNVTAVVRPGDFPLADMLEQEGCAVTVCS